MECVPFTSKQYPFHGKMLGTDASGHDHRVSRPNDTVIRPARKRFRRYNEDIGLAKEIRFKERYSFTLEGHAFNAFNRVLFGGLDSYGPGVNSDFGHMNGQENTARVLQVSGTLKFLNSVSSARMCRRVPQCWNAVAFFIFGHPPNGVSGDICCADHLVAWKWTIPQAQIASANAVEQGQPKQPPGCKRDVRLSSYAASHARATVTAIDIAAPRIRFGKISEMRTHVTGASDIREHP